MNFRSLEYYIAIVENGSVSKAANELFISQQALSDYLAKLEHEVGTPLLIRGRPMQMTYAGRCFLEGAQEILKVRDDTMDKIRTLVLEKDKKIFIGEVAKWSSSVISLLIKRFCLKYPDFEFVVRSVSEDRIANEPDIDFFFTSLPLKQQLNEKFEVVEIFNSNNYAVIAKQSLLDEIYGDEWLRIEQKMMEKRNLFLLRNLPFIMLRDSTGRNDEILEHIFENAGFKPKTTFRSERNGLNFDMCIQGIGALLSPEILCKSQLIENIEIKNTDIGDMRLIPVNIPFTESAHIGMCYRKDWVAKMCAEERQFIGMACALTEEIMKFAK